MSSRIEDGIDKASDFMHHSMNRALIWANIVLAILMIFYAVMYIFNEIHTEDLYLNDFIAAGSLVICASMILIDKERNLVRSAGFLTLGLGCFRIFSVITLIVPGEMSSLVNLATLIIGINLMYTGSMYIKGVARGRIFTVLGMVAMIYINVSTYISFMQMGFTLAQAIEMFPVQLGMTVLYFGTVCILESEPIRSRDLVSIQNRMMHSIVETHAPMSGIDRETADILLSSMDDRSSWIEMNDEGPVMRELRFMVKGNLDRSHVIVQEWEGHDLLHVTVCDHGDGTILHANRFSYYHAEAHTEEDGAESIRLYGPEGCHGFHILTDEEQEALDPYV